MIIGQLVPRPRVPGDNSYSLQVLKIFSKDVEGCRDGWQCQK